MSVFSQDERAKLILSLGTHRKERPLQPMEASLLLQKGLDSGMGRTELAEMCLLRNSNMIGKLISLLRLPTDVQKTIKFGNPTSDSISMSTASQIARIKAPEAHQIVGDLAIQHKLNEKELAEIVELVNNFGTSYVDAVNKVLNVRPLINRVFVFVGRVASSELREQLARMSRAERDAFLYKVWSSISSAQIDKTLRLEPERFVLSGGQSLATLLNGLGGGWEHVINRELTSNDDIG